MAGNTLTFYTSYDFTGGGTIDFTVWIRQPYANTTSNCQVKIKAEGTSLKKTYVITSVFSSITADRYSGPSLTIPGGTNSVESGWTTVTGLSCNTGNTYFYGQMTMKAGSTTDGTASGSVTGVVYWTGSPTTTAPGAPGGVRVGTSTSYASNTASNYNIGIPSPNSFYITWTAGSAGTGNAIAGYRRRVVYSSSGNVVSGTTVDISGTSTLYSKTSGYLSTMVGVVVKAEVQTLGTVSGLNSGWTRSTNTVTFTNSGGTSYTAPSISGVRVGTSTSYSSNSATNYNVGAPTPGEFYITWTGATAGTNNAIASFSRRVIYSSNNNVVGGTTVENISASATYTKSSGWGSSNTGYAYKAEVMAVGSVSGYNSAWVRSSNTVTLTSASSGVTLTANANGGSPNKTYTNTTGTKQELDTPTYAGYTLDGWYFDSTANNGVSMGAPLSASTSFRVRFWTYSSDYSVSTSLKSIVSCAEEGGWTFTCEDKTNWAFQVCTASGTWKSVKVPISGISNGYHEWSLICNLSNKTAYVFMDGTSKGSVALGVSSVYYKSSGVTYKVILGNEMNASGSYPTSGNYGFVGYIGNFVIDSGAYTTNAAPDKNIFTIPEAATTVYAYWKRTGYNVIVNPNGGTWNGSTSNSTISVTYGTNKSIAAPTRAGYDFVGWASLNARFSNDYTAGTGFFTSAPGQYIWNGSGTNNSSLSIVNMDTASGFPSGAKMLQITDPGTSSRGVGWYKVCKPAKNTEIVVVVVAKMPRGTYLACHNSTNYQGTGYTWEYLTPMAGTGAWKTYAIKFTTGVVDASSSTVDNTGYFVLCGNSEGVAPGNPPNSMTAQIAWQNIGLFSKINSSETYVPNTSATSDTITAVWKEKQYSIDYDLAGGDFPTYGLNNVYIATGSGATAQVRAYNPENAFWYRSPYYLGDEAIGNNPKARVNGDNWFAVEAPTKPNEVVITEATLTTSFNAASSVEAISTTKLTSKQTPQNFYKWTISGLDNSTHYYWGISTTGTTTTNTQISFTGTSITVTKANYLNNTIVPVSYFNLRQSPGQALFTAGYTPGTTTTTTITTPITLPSIPAKANGSTSVTRTVYYNANGGTGTTTAQSVTPTATITYSNDGKWYTTSSGSTVAGTQGTAYTPTANTTLYAHYSASTSTYTSPAVTLRTGLTKSPDYIDEQAVTLTTQFSAATSVTSLTSQKQVTDQVNYTFDKWRLNSITGTSYSAGASFTPTATSATFYATWTSATSLYTTTYSTITLPTIPTKANTTASTTRVVNYNRNGSTSATPSAQTVTPTATVTWADDNKWYTSSAYTTVAGNENTAYTPTTSATLYAKYTGTTGTYSNPTIALPASLVFPSVSTTTTTTATLNFSAASAVTAKTTTKTVTSTQPKTFDKWRLGSATGTSYAAGANFTPTTGSTTFYATSKDNGSATSATVYGTVTLPNVPAKSNTTDTITRTVNYNANGGTGTTTAQTVSPTATVTWSDDDKWYTASSGGTGYTQGTNYTLTTDNGTLYAHYTASTGTYSSPSVTLRSALTFASVTTTTTTNVTINFSAASAVTAKTTTKTVVTTQPKTFDKWRLGSATGTSYAAGSAFTPTVASTTFYATSKNNGSATSVTTYGNVTLPNVPAKSATTSTITRTVNYDANGGSSTPSAQSVSPTAPITWTDDDKWYTASSGGTGYSQGTAYTLTQDNGTLYAHYSSSTGSYSSPTLALRAAISKTSTSTTITTSFNGHSSIGGNPTAITSTATQAYTFNKWALGSTTGTQYSASATFTPTVDTTTFYATWNNGSLTGTSITLPSAVSWNPDRVTTTLTTSFNANGGSNAPAGITSNKTAVSTYSFNGWHVGSTTGTTYAAGAKYTPTVSGTMHAGWTTANSTEYTSITLPAAPTTKGDTTANKTVTFNANGGSVTPGSTTFVATTSYKFNGWGTTSTATSGSAAGTTITPTTSATYYATWAVNSTTAAAVSTPVPTRTGYTVTGWYTASSGGTKRANAGSSYTPPVAGETVYAQWSGYVVSVTSASTTMGTASGGGTYSGSSLTITASPKTGYHFVKWTGGDVNNNTNASVSFTPTSSFTATANFAANTYTVVYNKNGGSGTMANSTFTYNGTGNLTANAFTAPDGYTFAGWANSVANATAGAVLRSDGVAHGNLTSTDGGTVNLYAIWRRTIYFRGRSGSTSSSSTVYQYYNSQTSAGASITTPSTAPRTPDGWTFIGWRDDTTAGAQEINPGGTTTPTTVTDYYAVYSATITFYHGYNKAKTDTATGYFNAYSVSNTAVTAPAIQSISYWTAYGWKPDTTTTTSGAKTITTATTVSGMGQTVFSYYALYSQSATLTYAGNGNTGGSTSASTSNTRYLNSGTTTLSSTTLSWTLRSNGFTKTGYTFNGWDVGAAGATYSPTIAYNANPAKTATAQWTANTYTVHYNSNGGTGTTMSDSSFTYDGTGNLRSNTYTAPTASGGGWAFQGWATTQARATAGTVDRTNGAAHGNLATSGEITLYAVWKRTINFYNGVNKATNSTVTQLWNGSAGVAITTPTPATISNWTALGWRDDTTAGAKEYSSAASLSPATTTYYAVYSSTITFYQGYNKATTNTATGYYNSNNVSTVTAPAISTLSYWTTRGWRDDTTASDREYAVTTNTAITGFGTNRTFYAVYSQSATLTYAGNGNTGGSTASTTSNTRYLNSGNTALSSSTLSWTLASNGFTKTGYSFNKWDVGNAGATYSPTIAYNANPAKTATAQWTPNNYTLTIYPEGGNGSWQSVTVTQAYGSTYTLPTYTRPGYLFNGWDKSGAGSINNNIYTFGAGTCSIYALWGRQGATRNMYVFNGTEWKVADPYVFDGTKWRLSTAYVFNGTEWKPGSTPKV